MEKENKRSNITPVQTWLGNSIPLVISGPCSAETEEQVLVTAQAVAKIPSVKILRAGIWKPRTRPGSFQGVGEVGLKWLKKAGEETGLLTATEVANAQHVEACLEAGIDILWIGARTTVNPFSVQEIADAVKGVDIPVFIKNPMTPDLQLWIGAIERILQAGIIKTAAIHRGFTNYAKGIYRNEPMWEFPIALKTEFPEISLFCDPSHIAGKREFIPFISQKAMDLNMDGLMIEAHPDPDNALSDSAQQLTPRSLGEMLSEITLRMPSSQNKKFIDQLSKLREKIDELDDDLVALLAKRMEVARKIGQYKKENNVTILQMERWEEILKRALKEGLPMQLSEEFIKTLFQGIHTESIQQQNDVMN